MADRLTPEAIVDAVVLVDGAMREAGFDEPCIALCCLNPHCSDGGAFGDEERRIIEPAAQAARERVANVLGPYPADTIFMRAREERFDAIVTMYHDQGQIALKPRHRRRVTLQGGLPVPITTPAHGTARHRRPGPGQPGRHEAGRPRPPDGRAAGGKGRVRIGRVRAKAHGTLQGHGMSGGAGRPRRRKA